MPARISEIANDVETIVGLKLIDAGVIAGYFALVMGIGFWASTKVHNDEDFFLGGRRFGKGLLVMHWLCTGTHSEQAVQVAGACARVGLGGIWYQWMYLFSTPFYWLIGPMVRRLRVITTGEVFRIRYGWQLELVYSLVALVYIVLSIAMLLRGAGAAIAGATGSAVLTNHWVIALSVLFSTYVMVGGLMAAAYTDFLQGVMLIVLSVLLVPAGLNVIGGMAELQSRLPEGFMSVVAPAGAKEGHPLFVVAMSILGLAGIVAQPHVMTSTGSGKTELEARVGMCYGNFIKRFLTIAWAFTGLIALVLFPKVVDVPAEQLKEASETLFGQAIQHLLGDGWRGLMIACIIAGVTSAETIMVVGSGVFTRNFYAHVVPEAGDRQRMWVGRIAAAGILVASIAAALAAGNINDLLKASIRVVGLMGPLFWLGVTWRRANPAGAWCSLLTGGGLWYVQVLNLLPDYGESVIILLSLAAQFAVLILVSLLTPRQPDALLDPFFARLHIPVGREAECEMAAAPAAFQEEALLGLHGQALDYEKASRYAYQGLQKYGIEIPRMKLIDWGGFLAAWATVGVLIALLVYLASLGK
ncbi:MAG: sodium:solute symporter family protein [Planctomycetia bacterium]|nr:sodium:solute symporter family protein [Planctomycetia bacterium]